MAIGKWFEAEILYQNAGGGPGGGSGHGGGGREITDKLGTTDITDNATGDTGLSGGTGVSGTGIITSDAAPGEDAGAEGDDIDSLSASANLEDVGTTSVDIVDVGDPMAGLGGGPDDGSAGGSGVRAGDVGLLSSASGRIGDEDVRDIDEVNAAASDDSLNDGDATRTTGTSVGGAGGGGTTTGM